MTGPLMLLDSAGLWFRAYYALPESLTAPDGTPVNAVRGFCDALAKLLGEQRPARLVACLDNDWRPQFRVDALPSYKAHRVAGADSETDLDADSATEAVPDTLSPQIPVIAEVLDAADIASAEAEGLEADDVIGTLVAREPRDAIEIVTGDRDLFQLVRPEPPVHVLYLGAGPAKVRRYGPSEVAERYGLPVDRAGDAYAEMAVLRGDPSDGLPGVAGIGEKTAAKLINQFGSLDAILAAETGDTRLTPRLRAKLADAADYLAVAPSVVRVVRDAPVMVDREDTLPRCPDPDRLRDLQQRWGLGGSIDRLRTALAQ